MTTSVYLTQTHNSYSFSDHLIQAFHTITTSLRIQSKGSWVWLHGHIYLVKNSNCKFVTLGIVTLPMFGGGRKNALDSMLEITNEIIWAIQNGGGGQEEAWACKLWPSKAGEVFGLSPAKGTHLKLSLSTWPLPVWTTIASPLNSIYNNTLTSLSQMSLFM